MRQPVADRAGRILHGRLGAKPLSCGLELVAHRFGSWSVEGGSPPRAGVWIESVMHLGRCRVTAPFSTTAYRPRSGQIAQT